MNPEIVALANKRGWIVSSIWNGYTRRWIVTDKETLSTIITTDDYSRLMAGLNTGSFRPL